uniref:Heme oxygenase 1 n=1 Tax=Monodelphis domestica TaxID=13616 RepID=A0A5F8HIZ7_MONDO
MRLPAPSDTAADSLTMTCFQMVMSSLYHIYLALEEEMEQNKRHPALVPIYFPEELARTPALEQDMRFWYGPRWRHEIPYTAATKKYVERLRDLGRTEPELLVAHAYTRYLGDLSGGQILKKIAQKSLGLPSTGEGVAFFTFPAIANATKFKQLYRSRMNAIEMSPATKKKVVEEAQTSFLLNIEVFEELQELLSKNQENGNISGKQELRKRAGHTGQGKLLKTSTLLQPLFPLSTKLSRRSWSTGIPTWWVIKNECSLLSLSLICAAYKCSI